MRTKIASLNIKGRMSGSLNKWWHIPQLMRDLQIGILAVQEMHLTAELAAEFNELFANSHELIHSPDPESRNTRGVAFVLNKRMVKTDDLKMEVLVPGRAILVSIPWRNDSRLVILNIYVPNVPGETREFWLRVRNGLRATRALKLDIMLGDFNLVEDALDRIPCSLGDPQATELLREVKSSLNLVDGWWRANPNEKGYTWVRDSDGTQSRLDRIYVREDIYNDCTEWGINASSIPSDHDIVGAKIAILSDPVIGRGRWTIPMRLIRNRRTKPIIQELGRKLQERLKGATWRTAWENPQRMLKEFKVMV